MDKSSFKLWKFYYKAFLFKKIIKKQMPECFLKTNSIFIHVPKAAGISIANSVYGQQVGHIPARVYRSIDGQKFQDCFKFSLVRHPVKRLQSAYFFLKKGGLFDNKFDQSFSKEVVSKYPTFEEFVMTWINDKNIYNYIHFFPQNFFLTDKNGNIIIDHVGKVEEIEFTIELIKDKVNQNIDVKRENVTNYHRNIQIPLHVEEKIKEVYATDFLLFGY